MSELETNQDEYAPLDSVNELENELATQVNNEPRDFNAWEADRNLLLWEEEFKEYGFEIFCF
jgi:hypothetical protein